MPTGPYRTRRARASEYACPCHPQKLSELLTTNSPTARDAPIGGGYHFRRSWANLFWKNYDHEPNRCSPGRPGDGEATGLAGAAGQTVDHDVPAVRDLGGVAAIDVPIFQ